MSDFHKVVRKCPELPSFYDAFYGYGNIDFLNNCVILDIETTGVNEDEDIIICCGTLDIAKSIATIYFLDNPRRHAQFLKMCRSHVITLMKQGKRIWAYNSEFEESFLGIKGINDLMCYYSWYNRGKMSICYQELINHFINSDVLPEQIRKKFKEFKEQFECKDVISGARVPRLYFYGWVIRGDEEARRMIIEHNYCDLVKEAVILYFVIFSFTYAVNEIHKRFRYFPIIFYKILSELVNKNEDKAYI